MADEHPPVAHSSVANVKLTPGVSTTCAPKGVDLYVATPCYGCKLTAPFLASLLHLQGECMRRGISMACQLLGNESLVPRARNILIEQFVQSGASTLLFLDADLAFAPSMVLDRLLPFAQKRPDAIVTGVYPKKAYEWSRVDSKNTQEPIHMQVLDYNLNVVPNEPAQVVDGFVKVLDSATGAMMLTREVIVKLREKYKEALHCVNDISPGTHPVKEYVAIADCMIDPETRRYLSEDYALCRKQQHTGGEIYVDLTSGMCHIGTMTYEGDIRKSLRAA